MGALLAAIEWWLLAGIVATAGSAFDMFDGAVARVTGTTSKLGAFMDSTFDRWGEAVVYLGIVIGCTRAGFDIGVWLAAAAMGSAFMVSYARARAESLGFAPGKGMAAVGLAPREVRVVILGIGLVGAGLFGGVAPGATGQTDPGRRPSLSSRSSRPSPSSSGSCSPSSKQPRRSIGHEQERQDVHATATATAKARPAGPSASPSWASATAPAASSRAATTTRTPRTTSSCRA